MILFNWTARRSGASITITGVDAAGIERTLTGIQKITQSPTRNDRSALAYDANGDRHQLVIEPRP